MQGCRRWRYQDSVSAVEPSSRPRALSWLPELLLGLPVLVASRVWSALPSSDDPAAGLLSGPDAGEWALNAQALAAGDLDRVDPHRLPTFLVLLALAQRWTDGDIAVAGHLVGVGAWLAMVAATTLLGRLAGGPAVGAVAGLLVTGVAPLVHAAARFGVDPVLAAVLTLSMAAVGPARRTWGLGVVAGVVAGVAVCTHLTALPYFVPAMLLLVLRGGREGAPLWQGVARVFVYAVGVLAVVALSDIVLGLMNPASFVDSVSEGIAAQHTQAPQTGALTPEAQSVLSGRADTAWVDGAQSALAAYFVGGLPWTLLLTAFWLGVLGPALPSTPPLPSAPLPRWLRRRLSPPARARLTRLRSALRSVRSAVGTRVDLAHGLPLLCCLAPVPVLAAAGAEPRYAANLLPFVAVLLARGLAWPVSVVARWTGPVGVLVGGALLCAAVWPTVRVAQDAAVMSIPPPTDVSQDAVKLAAALEKSFPVAPAVATPLREAAAHLGRQHCPRASCVGDADAAEQCLAHLKTACSGEGPVPLVWLERGPPGMGDDPVSQATGALAVERYGAAQTVTTKTMRAVLVAVPRD